MSTHAEHVERDRRRGRIKGLVRANPGITADALARRLSARPGDIQLELAELEAAGVIFKDTCPGCRRWRWQVR